MNQHADLTQSRIIAIAGGSGSGKSTLAEALVHALNKRFGAHAAQVLSEDDYYLCCSEVAQFDPLTHDFDSADAKDMALLARHIDALRRGTSITKPLYDFATHTRRDDRETVSPTRFVILEGIHAFTDPRVAAVCDLRVLLDAPGDVRLARRLLRDIADRGRTVDSVITQYFLTVRPNHEAVLALQKNAAHVILCVEPDTNIAGLSEQVLAQLDALGLATGF